jgi:uncharacterized protein YbbC (DUF1343 family)
MNRSGYNKSISGNPWHPLLIITLCLSLLLGFSECRGQEKILTGADRTGMYLPMLKGKRIGIVANQTSVIGNTHLVDSLISLGDEVVSIGKVFSPEHGFRGEAEAGLIIEDKLDARTGLPVISLYGRNRKPSKEAITDLDIILFDIQDVGARFYTYISTLFYVMQACAENNKKLILLDRPNPNGFYVDGPILDLEYKSFIGMHPVPIVHGLTIAEYARMINGEGWLNNGIQCKLTSIPCKNYDHNTAYELPVKPSPNLPNILSIYLYPSLCLFEGTIMSVGRGTDYPFQVLGHPEYDSDLFSFTTVSKEGASNPKYEGIECKGVDLRDIDPMFFWQERRIILDWIIEAYNNMKGKGAFFNSYFSKLSGTQELQKQIESGVSPEDIYKSWEPGLKEYKKIRKKYLLYPDFE